MPLSEFSKASNAMEAKEKFKESAEGKLLEALDKLDMVMYNLFQNEESGSAGYSKRIELGGNKYKIQYVPNFSHHVEIENEDGDKILIELSANKDDRNGRMISTPKEGKTATFSYYPKGEKEEFDFAKENDMKMMQERLNELLPALMRMTRRSDDV